MINDIFNERDPQRRRAAIQDVFAADVVFTDPEEVVTGWDALADKVDALLAGAPDFVFRLAAPVQDIADLGMDRWELGPPGGEPVVRGTDVALIVDGKIARLYTLIDPS
jgi:hypothetical protein